MSNELKITRIREALRKYNWVKADTFKKDAQTEWHCSFGMLLRFAGVPLKEFEKRSITALVLQNIDLLVSEYGLRDGVDLELITISNAAASSQEEMVWRITESLSGNLSAVHPAFRAWMESLMKNRENCPLPKRKVETRGKYYSSEKLYDVRWLEKRIEVLKRDGERCQGSDANGKACSKCSKNGDLLEVHHRNYTVSRETGNPWDEPIENLITLCREHHEQEKNANLGQAARDVCAALMNSNWMVRHRRILERCIAENVVSAEELCQFIEERRESDL